MKIPKAVKRFCAKCKKHTEHTVQQAKKKNPSPLTYGSKVRARRRGSARGKGNMGRYSKPAISKFKMTGKKASKKIDLRYTCKECKKTSVRNNTFRAKKVEFT